MKSSMYFCTYLFKGKETKNIKQLRSITVSNLTAVFFFYFFFLLLLFLLEI